MKNKIVVIAIGITEVLIGLVTLSGLTASLLFSFSNKPFGVLIYVLGSAAISASLGIGLLCLNELYRKLLIFFSGYVILIKVMVFLGALQFTGELVTMISSPIKNTVSVFYHIAVIVMLDHPAAKRLFKRQGGPTHAQ